MYKRSLRTNTNFEASCMKTPRITSRLVVFMLAVLGMLSGVAFSELNYIYEDSEATYSIVALDPETGELGIGVQSDTIAVASRTRWGRGGVAAIASQASSNPMFGELGVLLLERGFSPEEALEMMVRMDNGALNRQFAIIDIQGRTAAWTSPNITDWKGHLCGENFCAQGNTLVGPEVIQDMASTFLSTEGSLIERILAGLEAAEAAGGDRRGTQSAGILILRPRSIQDYGDWAIDLRVDESPAPLVELRRILNARFSQQQLSGLGTLINEGQYDEALTRIEAALELDPTSARAFLARANVFMAMGDSDETIESLASAIDVNSKVFFQVLRNDSFAPIHDDPAFLALGDIEGFAPLAPSAPEGLPALD